MAREALRISRKVGGTNNSQVPMCSAILSDSGKGEKWTQAEEIAREVLEMVGISTVRNIHRWRQRSMISLGR